MEDLLTAPLKLLSPGTQESAEHTASTLLCYRDLALLETIYSCGLRISELCGLKVTDVDRLRLVVSVLGKGSKRRLVPRALSAVSVVAPQRF